MTWHNSKVTKFSSLAAHKVVDIDSQHRVSLLSETDWDQAAYYCCHAHLLMQCSPANVSWVKDAWGHRNDGRCLSRTVWPGRRAIMPSWCWFSQSADSLYGPCGKAGDSDDCCTRLLIREKDLILSENFHCLWLILSFFLYIGNSHLLYQNVLYNLTHCGLLMPNGDVIHCHHYTPARGSLLWWVA